MQKTMAPSDSDTFWKFSTEYWFEKLETSASGLSKKEAASRLSHTGADMPAKFRIGKDVLLFIGQFKSPLMLMLLGAVILSVFLGDTSDVFIFFLLRLCRFT